MIRRSLASFLGLLIVALVAIAQTPSAQSQLIVITGSAGSGGSSDTTPDAFSFTDQTDVATSSTITSAAITVAGINAAATITVSGGTYDINASGSFTSSSGTVNNGDTVRARHTSSSSNSTAVDTTVTIGGVSDTFTSTTGSGEGGGADADASVGCTAGANTLYVRAPGGSYGSENGSDWNNAFDGIPSTKVRNRTYCVADGNYGDQTLSTAASSNQTITIVKATVASHGTDTGWDDTLGDGVATFGDSVSFLTDDWIFDGGKRDDWESGYGFKISYTSGSGQRYISIGQAFTTQVDNITIRYVDVEGSDTEDDSVVDRGINAHCGSSCTGSSNILIDRVRVAHMGNVLFHMLRTQGLTIQYSWLEDNSSTPTNHGEGIVLTEGVSDFTFRYNVMKDIEGTAYIATPTSGHPACSGTEQSDWYIYGNVFRGLDETGAGAIYVFDANHTGDFFVYNNSFIDLTNGFVGAESDSGSAGCIATLTLRNNLWYSTPTVGVTSGGSGTASNTHGAYIDSGDGGGTNKYTGSGDPFEDWENEDFRLTSSAASSIDAGATLSAPYDEDSAGVTRGADSKWDRGAREFAP